MNLEFERVGDDVTITLDMDEEFVITTKLPYSSFLEYRAIEHVLVETFRERLLEKFPNIDDRKQNAVSKMDQVGEPPETLNK